MYADVVHEVDPRYPGSGGGSSGWERTDVLFPFGDTSDWQAEMLYKPLNGGIDIDDLPCVQNPLTREWKPYGCHETPTYDPQQQSPVGNCEQGMYFSRAHACDDYDAMICRAFELIQVNRADVLGWAAASNSEQFAREFTRRIDGGGSEGRIPIECRGAPYNIWDELDAIVHPIDAIASSISCERVPNFATGFPRAIPAMPNGISLCRWYLEELTVYHAAIDALPDADTIDVDPSEGAFQALIWAMGQQAVEQKRRYHLVADLDLAAVILHEMTHLITWRLNELVPMSLEDWFRDAARRRYGLGEADGCDWTRTPGPTGLYAAVPGLQGLPTPANWPWL